MHFKKTAWIILDLQWQTAESLNMLYIIFLDVSTSTKDKAAKKRPWQNMQGYIIKIVALSYKDKLPNCTQF